jgi:3-methylcrotonyl-CoA carboxylase alpha subunit
MLAAGFEASATTESSRAREQASPWQQPGGWRVGGAARSYRYRYGDEELSVSVLRSREGALLLRMSGDELEVLVGTTDAGSVVIHQGSRMVSGHCIRTTRGLVVGWKGRSYELVRPELERGRSATGARRSRDEATSPMPGTVVKISVRPGQAVAAREPLAVIEAMKMEHVIEAPHAGVVSEILYEEGDMVPAGTPIVRLEES